MNILNITTRLKHLLCTVNPVMICVKREGIHTPGAINLKNPQTGIGQKRICVLMMQQELLIEKIVLMIVRKEDPTIFGVILEQ